MKHLAKELIELIFKTYVINICSKHLFVYPRFQGLPIIVSDSADKELAKLNLELDDIKYILKEGFSCERSKRKDGVLERCIKKGNKTIKAVAVKSHNYALETDCWLIIHIGVF